MSTARSWCILGVSSRPPPLGVALHERVVEPGDADSRVHGQLLLDHEAGVLLIEDAVEGVHIVCEVLEAELHVRSVVGARVPVEVVDAEGAEVACAEHARLVTGGHVVAVAQRLLDRRDHAALALFGFVQVDVRGLLLDEEAGVGEQHVDVPAVGGAAFKLHLGGGVGDVQHIRHQIDPELGCFLFLVTVLPPPVDELRDALLARRACWFGALSEYVVRRPLDEAEVRGIAIRGRVGMTHHWRGSLLYIVMGNDRCRDSSCIHIFLCSPRYLAMLCVAGPQHCIS